jgi:hypothetical protein
MRIALFFALLLAISAPQDEALAGMRNGGGHGARIHVQHHRLHQLRTNQGRALLGGGLYADEAPYVEGAAPEPAVVAAPPSLPLPLRRVGNDRPTVEHTDVGVTIIRGPSHLAP